MVTQDELHYKNRGELLSLVSITQEKLDTQEEKIASQQTELELQQNTITQLYS